MVLLCTQTPHISENTKCQQEKYPTLAAAEIFGGECPSFDWC